MAIILVNMASLKVFIGYDYCIAENLVVCGFDIATFEGDFSETASVLNGNTGGFTASLPRRRGVTSRVVRVVVPSFPPGVTLYKATPEVPVGLARLLPPGE